MVIGLFIVVALMIMLIEVWLFRPEMINSWFESFELKETWLDHLRIAVVVATPPSPVRWAVVSMAGKSSEPFLSFFAGRKGF